MRYVYSLIRYVPDPISGEFVNVGAIVGSDESSEWQVRQVDNPARARRLDERGSLPAVWSFIDKLGREVDAHEEAIARPKLEEQPLLSEAWLADVYARHHNIVQLSAPSPIVAASATEALDDIFGQLIVDPERHSGGDTSKHAALAAVRRAYRQAGLQNDVHERVIMHAGDHRQRIDFAVANGRVVQLAQTWSFRVGDLDALAQSVRAWGFTVQAAKRDGGSIEVDGRSVSIPRDVDVTVVVVPAEDDVRSDDIEDAKAVFRDVGAVTLDIGDADQAAAAASSRLAPASA